MSRKRTPSPLFRSLQRLRAAFWRRRVARWLIRTAWLALLVPTIFLAGYLWLGWQVEWTYWVYPMLAIVFISFLWALRPIRLKTMVHRLDRNLGLRARLITGYEMSHLPSASPVVNNPVVQGLFQETVVLTATLRRRVHAFNPSLWLEMQALIAVAALFCGLVMLDTLQPRLPKATPVALPEAWQEPTAEEVLQPEPVLMPPPFLQQPQALSQEQLQGALQALADALRDPAVTRSIAEALDRGDLAGAAEGLRRLADQLGELSDQAQSELSEALGEAADRIGGEAPDLTEPLEAGSQALGEADLRQAAGSLEALADALEALEEAPQETAQTPPQGEGEGQPEADSAEEPAQPEEPSDGAGSGEGEGEGEGGDQPTEEERLAVEGQPLELESDPELEERVLQPAELDAEGEGRTSDSPFARQPLNAAAGDLGPDPLVYPWDKREVIRSYFTP